MTQFGALPQLDSLDKLKTQRGQQDVTFTAVGYGLQKSFPDATSYKDQALRIRMFATPKLNAINNGPTGDSSLILSNNAHTGGTCAGTGGVYRVDRQDDLDFLATFGVTP